MIFASNNKNKLREIKSIFNEHEIISLKEANINIEVEEDAEDFFGNALKKAKAIYEVSKKPVIADDSGLCITSLNDWPGVNTHRFAGEVSEEERNNIIVDKVKNISSTAKVVCVLVYYDGTNTINSVGILNGNIVSPRGNNGFGFDPIFELENGQTLAELSEEEKNKCSARYLAAKNLKEKLSSLI